MERIQNNPDSIPTFNVGDRIQPETPVVIVSQEGHPDDFTNWILIKKETIDETDQRTLQQLDDTGHISERVEVFNSEDMSFATDKAWNVFEFDDIKE